MGRAADERRKGEQALQTISAALYDTSGNEKDLLKALVPFKAFNRNGLDCKIECVAAKDLSAETKEFMFDLMESNMEIMYEEAYGWDDQAVSEKRADMFDESARFFVVTDAAAADDILAFAQIQITIQNANAIIFLEEVQLLPAVQRKGLGKHLLQVLALVGKQNGIEFLLASVTKNNLPAMDFFTAKMKFEVDSSVTDFEDEDDEAAYEILSKALALPPKKATAAPASPTAAGVPAAATTPQKQKQQKQKQESAVAPADSPAGVAEASESVFTAAAGGDKKGADDAEQLEQQVRKLELSN